MAATKASGSKPYAWTYRQTIPKIYVNVLAGQSNAVGQASIADLSAANSYLAADYSPVLYTAREVDKATLAVVSDLALGDLRSTPSGRMGSELSLGRALDAATPAGSRVALLKYASSGSAINQWRDVDGTDFYNDFSLWLSSSIQDLSALGCELVFKKIFWMQGESESIAAAAPVYDQLFASFMQKVDTIQAGFTPVFSNLKTNTGRVTDPYAAQINQLMSASYQTTGSNDDLSTIDLIHWDADSSSEIGVRLEAAS